nr:hypothetical protein CFP56_00361 [Quercus suber]
METLSRSIQRSWLLVRKCIVLLQHALEPIETLFQNLHPRAIADANKVMAGAVEEIAALAGVEVEEDARHDDDLLLQAGLEEVEPVVDLAGQLLEIEPEVEGAVGQVGEVEAHGPEAAGDVVALVAEVRLQRLHLVAHLVGLEHGDGGFLEGHVGAAVEVGATGADSFDEVLGPDDPGHAPTGQAEALGQAVDDEHVILVDVFDVVRRADDGAVAVGRVVVAAVELIHDQSGAVTAVVLDLSQFWVGNHLPP